MNDIRSGIVDILRDFLVAHQMLTGLFSAFEEGTLRFEHVQRLAGDDDASVLFRLKERCHASYRSESGEPAAEVRREVLLDLAVGSLFHEAMKLRENLYQQEVYRPRIESLRQSGEFDADELFGEFEKILAAGEVRLEEAVQEARNLLRQTREQLRLLLREQRGNGLIARVLYVEREAVASVFDGELESLFEDIHGDVQSGYLSAAKSFLDSAYFVEALTVLRECADGGDSAANSAGDEVAQLSHYAEGMQAFMLGDYASSVERLHDWLDVRETPSPRYVAVARAAVQRLENLLGKGEPESLIEEAKRLADRLRALEEVAPA